ncbi:MAG: hypothetical protein AB7F25_10970 [Deferribacterales bacterium]
MNIKKLKKLTTASYIKLSLPLAVLFCVFFLRSVLESSIGNMASERFDRMLQVFNISIPEDDAKFTKALTTGKDPQVMKPFNMSVYLTNPFISSFFNRVWQQPVQETPQGAPSGLQAVQPPAPAYKISAVMNGRNKKCAVINGRLVNLGGNVDGTVRLTAVGDSKVLLEGDWGKKWYYVQY